MIDRREAVQKAIFCAGGLLCVVAAFAIFLYFGGRERPTSSRTYIAEQETVSAAAADGEIAVYISGAVKRPGVYRMQPGSRIEDALKAAGGLAAHADIADLNFAQRVHDEMQIYIPPKQARPKQEELHEPPRDAQRGAPKQSSPPSRGRERDEPAHSAKIDINISTEKELQALPGIGPTISRAIVEHREKRGRFKRIEDIKDVYGIGEQRFEAIRELITVSGR